ncbi:MAG TPA: triose-phosphate isomerase [Patescibacteria group bacterium]|nr:triose-phosphate isomerase [Patescibacteria group bacterium]
MIVLSLKTYKESSGDEVIKLARIAEKVNQDTGVPIWLCAQAFDIYRLVQAVKLPIWAQHLDPIDPDRHSGWLSPYSARQVGAVGAVINHAEHTVPLGTIDTTINKCRQYGLKTLVIADTIDLVKQVIELQPDYLAFERPDLIGGKVAMVDVEADHIKQVIDLSPVPVIVGAGIRTGDNVKKTLSLGGVGVILASAVVKAADQEAALRELASGFK